MTTQQHNTNSLALVDVDGEPRVHDLVIAERLGFEQAYDIRKLIKRHNAKLLKFGVLATVAKTSGGLGGRPTVEFYLNQRQAIFICMKSETERAFDVQAEIVRVFDAHLNGTDQVKPAELTREQILIMALDSERGRIKAEKELAEAQPMVQFHEEVSQADSELNVDETCALLFNGTIGPKQLRTWLKLNHWMDGRPGMNKPTAWAMKQNLMRLRLSPPINGRIFEVPILTGKGISTLRHLYRTNELFINAVPLELRLPAPDYSV
jgi:phage antirepressor YoqD-like protein